MNTELEEALRRFAAWERLRSVGAVGAESAELVDGVLVYEAFEEAQKRIAILEGANEHCHEGMENLSGNLYAVNLDLATALARIAVLEKSMQKISKAKSWITHPETDRLAMVEDFARQALSQVAVLATAVKGAEHE